MTFPSIKWNNYSFTHDTASLSNSNKQNGDSDHNVFLYACTPASPGHFEDGSSFNCYDQDGSQVSIYVPTSSIPAYDHMPPVPMPEPASPNHEQHQHQQHQHQQHQYHLHQVIPPAATSQNIPSSTPCSKRPYDESMVVWSTSSSPPPPAQSRRPFMFTDDEKYIITREGHVLVSVYLTQLHLFGAQFIYNPQGASFQLCVRGLPGAVFHFHQVFLTLQSLAFRQLYDDWDGRCGMFEVTVPFPESFPGVWEFLFTGDVAHFLRVCFKDSDTLRRTWSVMQCLRLLHLPEEIIFRARLEFEAVRLMPSV